MYFENLTKPVKTVTELNREIQQLLEGKFRFIRVIGEVSSLRCPHSGHYYFTLKDQQSQIRAVLFKGQRAYLQQELREGQQVICDGRITLYQPRGEYQLIVDTIDFYGRGQLQIAFEQLKQKLKHEGLFDAARKKHIPAHIEKLVVITSPSGAAIHDFLTICRRRRAELHIQILPVRVQGPEAAGEIVHALALAERLDPEVVVLCRGGGSIEDLWPFNEEIVARAISRARLPVVTGIGHETDVTIADFCADLRAATPTGAAELLIPDAQAYVRRIDNAAARMLRFFSWRLETALLRVARTSRFLACFKSAFTQKSMRLDRAESRLIKNMTALLQRKAERCRELDVRLGLQSPTRKLKRFDDRLRHLTAIMRQRLAYQLDKKEAELRKNAAVLDSVSPLATLARGYAIAYKPAELLPKQIITDARQVKEEDRIGIMLKHGSLECIVTSRRFPPP